MDYDGGDEINKWLPVMRRGSYLYDVGRIREMSHVRDEVVDALSHLLGPSHHLTLQARSDAAYAPLFLGNIRQAYQTYVQVAKAMQPPSSFLILLLQGQAEHHMNEINMALETLSSASKGLERMKGAGSAEYLSAQLRYAEVEASAGRIKHSINTLEHVRQAREQQYGFDDSFAMTTRLYLGLVYRAQGMKDLALANLESAVEFRRRFRPISDLVTADPAIILAITYWHFRLNDKAEMMVQDLETNGNLSDPDRSMRLCQVRNLKALLMFENGQTDEAITLLQDLLSRHDSCRALLWVKDAGGGLGKGATTDESGSG
ncbi:subtilisin-like serine protease [Purpureocillium lavendulum]|uniref:Subtilisin-like serine protease n=1 Tax=Purpureocillium lavendulum TaxID=1247861 RepID=A0AB34FI89_9HYPO|nr:subtilisin-like serine protease [Purpureocillium lavendulum]